MELCKEYSNNVKARELKRQYCISKQLFNTNEVKYVIFNYPTYDRAPIVTHYNPTLSGSMIFNIDDIKLF